MPKESNLEFKVGLFVICALVCLVAFVFSISDFSIFRNGQVYKAVFSYANGLKKNAPVRIAGVDAGHIRSIKPYFDDKRGRIMVLVEVWVDNQITIPVDSMFLVNQLGLLGEQYLEIFPGTATAFLAPGSLVMGDDPVAMQKVMRQVSDLGGKVEAVLSELNNGVLTDTNKQALAKTLSNIAEATGKINNEFLSEQNHQSLTAALANVAAMTDKVNQGQGTLGKFLNDPAFFNNLEELSADVRSNPWKLFYKPKGK